MSANDELPRGWTQSLVSATGGPTTITFPAIPGIAWTLTSIDAIEVFGPSVAGPTNVVTSVTTSLGTQGPTGVLAGTQALNSYLKDEYQWSGDVTAPVGVALTVTISASTDAFEYLTVSAYPG